MKSISLATAILCLILLNVACVTTQKFDETYRSKVKKVSIQTSKMPDFIYYGPRAALKAGIGNAIGGAIGSAITVPGGDESSDNDKFIAAFQKINFNPSAVISNLFAESLQKKLGIATVELSKADAEVTIQITYFGLGKGWGLTDQTKPFMTLIFEMKDKLTQSVIWREESRVVTTSDESEYHSYEEWLGNNDYLKKEFQKSIDVAVNQAIETLEVRDESPINR